MLVPTPHACRGLSSLAHLPILSILVLSLPCPVLRQAKAHEDEGEAVLAAREKALQQAQATGAEQDDARQAVGGLRTGRNASGGRGVGGPL